MEKAAIKDLMYGGIEEIIRNPKYYYHSQIGQNYCHLTEDGQKAVLEYMNTISYMIRNAEEADLERRAKDMALKELKA